MEKKTHADRVLEVLQRHPEGLRPYKISKETGIKSVNQTIRILCLEGKIKRYITNNDYSLYKLPTP